ncbi:unnamed protein product [Haemonchus placei]|uniref:Gag-pol polyprotein n=1 Tax=Haemonchus placei TaxID=6290 RepID=A0A0N4X1W4_HAEPC|nr:unnamed protein product [Haemonchus placei]
MNADRVWRCLILSKFTENICSQVIKKENQSSTIFEVKDILDAVDEIITLQEPTELNQELGTKELTTKTLFGTQTAQAMQNNARGHNGGRKVKDILDAVDEIITLQETTELTTKTLFGTQTAQAMQNNARGHNGGRNQMKQFSSHRLRHMSVWESHSPQRCARFPTPETRRMEAKRQGACWKCFDKTHRSRFCTVMGPCPKCKGDHLGSLCITSSSGLE